MDKAWELDSAKDGETRYFVIHGQLPKGINGDFGYPVCDTMNRHHCISPDEDEANARLIAAAPELLEALENAIGSLTHECSSATGSIYCTRCHAAAAIRKAKGEPA